MTIGRLGLLAITICALPCLIPKADAAVTSYSGANGILAKYSNTYEYSATNNQNTLSLQNNNTDVIAGIWDITYGNANGGGEFRVYNGSYSGFTYTDVNQQQRLFKTFCVEYNEHFVPGTSYKATIDKDALFGKNSGQTQDGSYYNAKYDPLSSATKWLYGKYFDGTLQGIDFDSGALGVQGFSYNDDVYANALQLAIWGLEDTNGVSGLAALMKAYAIAATSGGSANTYYDDKVKVLNLWGKFTQNPASGSQYSEEHQSQLVYVGPFTSDGGLPPVPEPATLAIWSLGLGLVGLVKLRSRQSAA